MEFYNSKIIDKENNVEFVENLKFETNFNFERINNLFSNLSSLTLFDLFELRKNYLTINYSTIEVDYHLNNLVAYPFLITIITILSVIIMLNIKFQKPKLFLIVLGIVFSVLIYYVIFSLEHLVKRKITITYFDLDTSYNFINYINYRNDKINENKIIITLLSLFIFIFNFSKIQAEEFVFESTSIEINKEDNTVVAKDGVTINSEDGLEITSNQASYFKDKKILILTGNVIIKDKIQNIIIRRNT